MRLGGVAHAHLIGLTCASTGPRAHQRAQVSTCWADSLIDVNPRRACPQGRPKKPTQQGSRPRRRTMIGSKYRLFRAPRIRIVAERPRPRRRDDGGRRGQGEEWAHPGSRRHVDAHEPVDVLEKTTLNNRRWETHGIKSIDPLERRGSGGRRRIQCQVRAL